MITMPVFALLVLNLLQYVCALLKSIGVCLWFLLQPLDDFNAPFNSYIISWNQTKFKS